MRLPAAGDEFLWGWTGGSSICEHQRQRNKCKDCRPDECAAAASTQRIRKAGAKGAAVVSKLDLADAPAWTSDMDKGLRTLESTKTIPLH